MPGWREKYQRLVEELATLAEDVEKRHSDREVPTECWSDAKEFYVSNDLEIVDNEDYARNHWGKGRYFKVRRVDAPPPKQADDDHLSQLPPEYLREMVAVTKKQFPGIEEHVKAHAKHVQKTSGCKTCGKETKDKSGYCSMDCMPF